MTDEKYEDFDFSLKEFETNPIIRTLKGTLKLVRIIVGSVGRASKFL